MTPDLTALSAIFLHHGHSPALGLMRAGIIYVSDSELGWQPMVESWLQKLKESEAAALRPCFGKLVGNMLDFVRCASRFQCRQTHTTGRGRD